MHGKEPSKAASSLTAAQKAKLKRLEREPEKAYVPQALDPPFVESLREAELKGISADRLDEAKRLWMDRLAAEDYRGQELDPSRYLSRT